MQRFMYAVGLVGLMALGQAAYGDATGDPVVIKDSVNAYDTDSHVVRFKGGESAAILVKGDGDTTLVLTVYDENGFFIARDTGKTCYVRWTPKWTGRFVIKVRNLGDVYNDYILLTN